MTIENRIRAFSLLGQYIAQVSNDTLDRLAGNARNENPWFTYENVKLGLEGIKKFLIEDVLTTWTAQYSLEPHSPRAVGVITAGNIPLVGFHDVLSVLISGHNLQLKQSSKDTVLLTHLINTLIDIEPGFSSRIKITNNQLKGFDAILAAGSDNSARYFEYYFGKYPNIIRKNRTSCAVLTGTESEADLTALGDDIFTYFGLGCRNVSKIFIPDNYDLKVVPNKWDTYSRIIDHHKYANNYDYQKSILLVNKTPHFDNGFVLLQESEKPVSPIAVLYYEKYSDMNSLKKIIEGTKDKLQCIVGNSEIATVKFGQAQFPEVWDYADNKDTLKFLSELI